jgi:hypothetical protein
MSKNKENKDKFKKEFINDMMKEILEEDAFESVNEFEKQLRDIERMLVIKLNKAGIDVKNLADKIKAFYEYSKKTYKPKPKRKPGRPLRTGKNISNSEEIPIILNMLEKKLITLEEAEALIEAIE